MEPPPVPEKGSINLPDLPTEVLDIVVSCLPTARSLSNLSRANQRLNTFAEQHGWQTFAQTHFPSRLPTEKPLQCSKDVVRTVTSTLRAIQRRALIARTVRPDPPAHPRDALHPRYRRPAGPQPMGFSPRIDCKESIGATWRDRTEILVFGAGAKLYVREKRGGYDGASTWHAYCRDEAREGLDDITGVHCLRSTGSGQHDGRSIIAGTVKGDLRTIQRTGDESKWTVRTEFITDGRSLRSTSLHECSDGMNLLAASLDDHHISIYDATIGDNKTCQPLTSLNIPNPERNTTHRIWSTAFLSSSAIAIGLGVSNEPLHIYALTPSGLSAEPLHRYKVLSNPPSNTPQFKTSFYPISPLHSSTAGSKAGQIFLTGGYDGVVRLHDLRSSIGAAQSYSSPYDDGAVYSLLPRGQESVMVGTGQHNLVKLFDLRQGGTPYSYFDVSTNSETANPKRHSKDWSFFLQNSIPRDPHPSRSVRPSQIQSRSARPPQTQSGSVYCLSSASSLSPIIYAGITDAVVELGFTESVDPHPDPAFFRPSSRPLTQQSVGSGDERPKKQFGDGFMNLAMHGHWADFSLFTQRTIQETVARHRAGVTVGDVSGLDERWHLPQ